MAKSTHTTRRNLLKLGGGAVALGGTVAVASAAAHPEDTSHTDPLLALWIELQRLDRKSLALYRQAEAIAENYPCKLEAQPVIFHGRQFGTGPHELACRTEDQVANMTRLAKIGAPFRGRTEEDAEAYGQQVLRDVMAERTRVKDLRRQSGYTALIEQCGALDARIRKLDRMIAETQAVTMVGFCIQAILLGTDCPASATTFPENLGHSMDMAARRMLLQAGTDVSLLEAA